jgi:hypothetical protein
LSLLVEPFITCLSDHAAIRAGNYGFDAPPLIKKG